MDNVNTKIKNDKFLYKEGEIQIAKHQCELCKYNNPENKNICSQFENGKPIEVLKMEKLCPKIKNHLLIDL